MRRSILLVTLLLAGCSANAGPVLAPGPATSAPVSPQVSSPVPPKTTSSPVPPANTSSGLPAITMTAGGGFAPQSQIWTIAPDGTWTYRLGNHLGVRPSTAPTRTGRLSAAQIRELAALVRDPALVTELHTPRVQCDVTDGPDERLKVGQLERMASWCPENLPHIAQLRTWIQQVTTGS